MGRAKKIQEPELTPILGDVPPGYDSFVPFGDFDDIKDVIESREFFPLYLSGPTRCGKTLMAMQICHELKRPMYRINVTIQTDETDLLGGYRLIDGNTVWEDGPIVDAAREGAIVLLDEVDLGSNKILCLQPILEGSPIYLKKPKKWIKPAKGFNFMLTGNTKGKGSSDPGYIGTQILSKAMIERCGEMYECSYPPKNVEVQILNKQLESYGILDTHFVDSLTQWADNIRTLYDSGNGQYDETMPLGRLVHIIKGFKIHGGDKIKAIRKAISFYDFNTQVAFINAYKVIDPSAVNAPDYNRFKKQPLKTW